MTLQLAWFMLLSLRGLTLAILSSMDSLYKDLAKLQCIQNIAARLICRVPLSHHITPSLQNLHWLPVNIRIAYKINLLTYKSNAGLSPTYLSDLLHDYVPSYLFYLFIYFKSLYRVACSVRDWSSTGPCAIKYRVQSDKVHTYNKIKLYKN